MQKKLLSITILFLLSSFLLFADIKTLTEQQIKDMVSHKWRLTTIEVKGKTIEVTDDKPMIALKFNNNGTMDEYAGDKHFTGNWTYTHTDYTIETKDKDGKEKHTILDISDKFLKMTTKFMGMKVVYVMKRVD